MAKHRTQVLLEEAQFQALSAQAARKNVSVSEIIRRLVERDLDEEVVPDLSAICGIASGPGLSARNHDDELYGPDLFRAKA